jgi:hypothetical protein
MLIYLQQHVYWIFSQLSGYFKHKDGFVFDLPQKGAKMQNLMLFPFCASCASLRLKVLRFFLCSGKNKDFSFTEAPKSFCPKPYSVVKENISNIKECASSEARAVLAYSGSIVAISENEINWSR